MREGNEVGLEQEEKKTLGIPRRKAGIMALIALAGLAVIGGLVWKEYSSRVVSTDNAKVTGDIVDISPKVSGRLEKIMVKDEERVEKGQVIAELDLIPLQLALQQNEATMEQAQANYDKLPADFKSAEAAVARAQEGLDAARGSEKSSGIALAEAERTFKQNQTLYEAGALAKDTYAASQAKYESAQASFETAQANSRVAQASLEDALAKNEAIQKTSENLYLAQLKKARADYEIARYNLENASIKAPISGTVVRIAVQAGENISPGQTILSVCDLENSYISANIEEKDIARIKPGQKVEVTIDAYSGKTINGQVASIGGAAQSVFSLIPSENTSGNYTKVTQRIPVRIIPEKGDVVLRPGMSAVVKIRTSA